MAPIFGRTSERVLLNEQFAAARSGRGNVVIVGGEAGIGKTTLGRDLVGRAVDAGALSLTGACYDLMATPPYGLWRDLGERYLRHPDRDGLPALPEALTKHGLDHVGTQAALFDAVTTFLEAITATGPLVLMLEDVHWADPASLELLRHVAARIGHIPLLALVTYRVDELTRENPFYQQLPSLVRVSEGLRLDLRPLDAVDLDALVGARYLLDDGDRKRLVQHLGATTEGNPFFVMEMLGALEAREQGGLVREGIGWRLGHLSRSQVPPLVRQVIDARVAHLGDAVRRTLTIASVIGHDIPLDVLVAVAGTDEGAILAAIDAAIDGHLCAESEDGSSVRFVHALTREALYTGIPHGRRRVVHRRVAEALEARPDGDADAIAWHYQQALDPRAPSWLVRAGDRAQRAYAWLTAQDRFATAARLLEAVPGSGSERARLLYRCGRLQRYANAPGAIASLRTATRLAVESGDHMLAADATYSRGLVQAFADDWAAGIPAMVAGVDGLRELPPSAVHITTADAAWMADALPTPETWAVTHIGTAADRAPKALDAAIVALDANRHMSLAWFLAEAGRLEEALALVSDRRQVRPDAGPLVIGNLGHAEFGSAIAMAALGDIDGAQSAFAAARRAYRAIDHHACLAFSLISELLHVAIPCCSGDLGMRRRLADEASREIELARGALPPSATPELASLPGLALGGRWPDARAIVDAIGDPRPYLIRRLRTFAVATIARPSGEPGSAWSEIRTLLPGGPDAQPGSAALLDALPLQQLAAELCLDADDRGTASRWLTANDRWLAWSGAVQGRAGNALGWARWHDAQGDRANALHSTDGAVELAGAPLQPLTLVRALRLRGELTHSEHDLEVALEHAAQCEVPIERAETLASLARMRRDPRLAEEAMLIARTLGARPLIGRLSQPEPSSVGSRPGGLTDRELEVLRLVAQGHTDAEVGDRLFISPRTVGQHLRSVYSKLDVRSRTEATRYAIEHKVV